MSVLTLSTPAGINVRNALHIAKDIGCRIEPVRRTGEIPVSHPVQKPYKLDARRKDCPRKLVVWLRSIAQRLH
jgi:hypothetical protein